MTRTRSALVACLVVLAACGSGQPDAGGPASQEVAIGSSAPATESPEATAGGRPELPSVGPEMPPCRYVEDAGLVDRATGSLEVEAGLGLFVTVEADDSRVVATTIVNPDGTAGTTLEWFVEDDGSLVGATQSTRRAMGEELTGEPDVISNEAVALAQDCAFFVGDETDPRPPPESRLTDPTLVTTRVGSVAPGEELELFFGVRGDRGIAFELQRRDDDGWRTTWNMVSDQIGRPPETVPVGEGLAVEDLGVGGPGPDTVLLDPATEPGTHRICTGNTGNPSFCTNPFEVAADPAGEPRPPVAERAWTDVGVVEEVLFGDSYSADPPGQVFVTHGIGTLDAGPPTAGPMTLVLTDGRQLDVPAGTPGATACVELLDDDTKLSITGQPAPSGLYDTTVRGFTDLDSETCVVVAEVEDGQVQEFAVLPDDAAHLIGPGRGLGNAGGLEEVLADGRLLTRSRFAFAPADDLRIRCPDDPADVASLLAPDAPQTEVLVDPATVTAVEVRCVTGQR